MKLLNFFTSAACIALAVSCISTDDPQDKTEYPGLTHIELSETDAKFPNPERGFYTVKDYHSNSSEALISAKAVESQRALNRTIFYNGYYPKDYMEGHIGEEFLQIIRTNMQTLRDNGAKCVLRFAYSES